MGELRFDPDVFTNIPIPDREHILTKINWLWDNRSLIVHHPLKHELSGFYKRVCGKYRIIYTYDNSPDDMLICIIGTRDEIYKDAVKKIHI